jgi:2-polyprenyl-6-methoxyphenol hydroxylase-like FAD-dependent oxidoreductase
MAQILVNGAGVCGLVTAMLLAKDGHDVTVLERDPAPIPASPDDAWENWDRRSVNQFRMIHMFLPGFRVAIERELPQLAREFDALGAIRYNPLKVIPPEMIGGEKPGDDRVEAMTARRPVAETAIARTADSFSNIEVRRGVVVKALRVASTPTASGVPHVVGVRTEDGQEIDADLVIDAAGRRSALPSMLSAIGARAPEEEKEDSGFLYYGRYFHSPTGEIPPLMSGLLTPWGTVSTLTLPADNGTYGLGIITSAKDAPLRALKDRDTWMRTWRSFPLIAHWADGEPIDGDQVAVMAKIEDRHRSFVVDGTPVATGVVAVADSWACTNPSLGRGVSIGTVHALALRDLVRDVALDDPLAFAKGWHEATLVSAEPWYRTTLSFDRHRLAEIDALIEGRSYAPGDPEWDITCAMQAGAGADGDVLRAFLRIASVLDLPDVVLAEPGLLEHIIEVAASQAGAELPAPTREELLKIVAA